MMASERDVAVVGSGVAGLTAAYVLQSQHRVTLYEAAGRLGGHAHTHEVHTAAGDLLCIDTGFIVHNERTYPNLLRLFRELGIATQDSEMSLSVRCEGCGLEYAGARGPRGVFAQPRRALQASFLRMLAEIPRFHRRARRLLAGTDPAAPPETPTLEEFLAGAFSRYFVAHFIVPLVSAVWSCSPQTALRYPAPYLFRFLDNHGLLDVWGSPTWKTVVGGSHEYVERVAKHLAVVRTGVPVRTVRRGADHVEVTTADGQTRDHDAVVLAVHADQALKLRANPTRAERQVLGAFRYSRNLTLLHTDASLLPRRPNARASWNYLLPSCRAGPGAVRVSYYLNRLQCLDAPEDYIVTLNDDDRVARRSVLAGMVYEHPIYTPESVAMQRRLHELSDSRLAYAGAYHGWGFHEDGCRSGVAAARALGVVW
jgi:uncharacterized protein